jgi:hypothetical protein
VQRIGKKNFYLNLWKFEAALKFFNFPRSGMLQPGDQILFIDNNSLRNKSISEINQLLNVNEEIIKLKIKKDESYTGKIFFKHL